MKSYIGTYPSVTMNARWSAAVAYLRTKSKCGYSADFRVLRVTTGPNMQLASVNSK